MDTVAPMMEREIGNVRYLSFYYPGCLYFVSANHLKAHANRVKRAGGIKFAVRSFDFKITICTQQDIFHIQTYKIRQGPSRAKSCNVRIKLSLDQTAKILSLF